MSDLFPITVEDEIQELEREVALRKRVYPRWVAAGKMTKAKADRQIAVMQSAVERLKELVTPSPEQPRP